jgi:hypothetical protein
MSDYAQMTERAQGAEDKLVELAAHVRSGLGLAGDELATHFVAIAAKLGLIQPDEAASEENDSAPKSPHDDDHTHAIARWEADGGASPQPPAPQPGA